MAAGDIVGPRQAPPGLVRVRITAASHYSEETPLMVTVFDGGELRGKIE